MHHSSTTDASEQDRSNPLRLCSAPRPPVAITFLLPWPLSLSLKRFYYLTKKSKPPITLAFASSFHNKQPSQGGIQKSELND